VNRRPREGQANVASRITPHLEAFGIAPSAVRWLTRRPALVFMMGPVRVPSDRQHHTASQPAAQPRQIGNETTLAQLVCDHLGVPIDQFDWACDTATSSFSGMGT